MKCPEENCERELTCSIHGRIKANGNKSASVPCYATGMPVRFLKSGSLCEFVEYLHGGQCRIKRADTGKEMIATLKGIEVV